jgi:hypothetical protein
MREFGRRAAAVSADVKRDKIAVDAVVHRGDGRDVVSTLGAKVKFDLAVFSPPYPNNIDYTEIYKLEAWLLGLIRSRDEFRSLRYETMRSHPSVAFPDDYPASDGPRRTEVMQLIDPLLRVVPPDRYRHARVRLIRGYFDDILQTFVGLRDVLRAGAYSVYVVGNSAHGHADGFVIAADVLIAALARLAGFEVRSMTIARRPSRRSVKSPFLRESIVVLQNPHVRSQPDSVPPKR